jgi:teichoic acid transport system permease protein
MTVLAELREPTAQEPTAQEPTAQESTAQEPTARECAERFGLSVSGARPDLAAYTRLLFQRRHFIGTFARARVSAVYMSARLGQVWQLLTPVMNAVVYYLIFGLILHNDRDIPDYIGFLCAGVFAFNFTQQTVVTATRSMSDNLSLIRALHFPRACMPLAVTLTQLQQFAFAVVTLILIVTVSGPGPTWHLVLLVPALALQAVFSAGLALVVARIGAKNTDAAQLMPFVMRTWTYASGVFYDIHSLGHVPPVARTLLAHNPMAIYLDLVRQALGVLKPHTGPPPHAWLYAAGWATLIGAAGYVYFWYAEQEYGRG